MCCIAIARACDATARALLIYLEVDKDAEATHAPLGAGKEKHIMPAKKRKAAPRKKAAAKRKAAPKKKAAAKRKPAKRKAAPKKKAAAKKRKPAKKKK